ncbi:MAG: hypothetical protein WCL32_09560 [Planctomycetota bacterium]
MLKPYFETEGPFGVPMKDAQAKLLEERLKNVPRDEAFALRRLNLARGLSEWQPEGRSDVSWITEEAPDRVGDVVLARGMDDAHFHLNPLVTLNHNYEEPPVGRSLWRKRVQEGALVGVKAKTFYPPRPDTWADGSWPPDAAFDLVQAGLLLGKSIGFIPLKLREPTAAERPTMKSVRFIIESWILVEYACCFLPMQPNAVVEQVLKAARVRATPAAPKPATAPTPEQVAQAVRRWFAQPQSAANLEKIVQHALTRAKQLW